MKHLDVSDFQRLAETMRQPFHDSYYAMYSSILGGIVTHPALMTVPIDDHMVHRGDGVFEAFKCVAGNIFNMAAHLDRLEQAARRLELALPVPRAQIEETIVETVRAGQRRDCMIRLFVSRGPGGFSTNPYECPQTQFYVVATSLGTPFMDKHPEGARARRSAIPFKPAFFATMKSCNYLPNVLMKKESVDVGADFVLAFDARGCLMEGSTENAGIVTRDGQVLFPKPDSILHGTTMLRVMELARGLVCRGELKACEFADISLADIIGSAEMLITGTTLNVVAVVEFDSHVIGDGRPGPVSQKLNALLVDDMHNNPDILTPVFG